MAWMNLHHLKYFLTIAEEGSLSAASKKLLVGQPALSAQLKHFEEWLGTTLFERRGKRLHITPEGEYVLKYAKAIKNLEEELMANLAHASDRPTREVTLGIQESVPKSVMARAISSLKKAGQVKIKVIEGTGEELFHLLTAGKADFFVGNFRPMSAGKEIIYVSLGKEAVYVWGSKESISLRKNYPKSLADKSFILPGFQNQLRHDFEKFMLQSGLHFETSIEAQDVALQKELASRGEGLVLLGEDSAKAWVTSGRLMKIGHVPGINEEYWLGMVKQTLDNDFIKAVMKQF